MSATPDSRPRPPQDKRMSIDNLLNPSQDNSPSRSPPTSLSPSTPSKTLCDRPRPESLTPSRYKTAADNPYFVVVSASLTGQGSSTSTGSSPLSSPQSCTSAEMTFGPHRSPSPALSTDSSVLSDVPSSCSGDFSLSRLASQYSSPPSSQLDEPNTPRSIDDSNCTSSAENDGPPQKRRRTERMPRVTQRLNLFDASPSETQMSTLDKLVGGFKKYKKIVVIAGAGISVSAGIPDFRSKDGLFKSLKSEHKLRGSGKDLFDASVYSDHGATETFHKMVRNMSEMVKDVKPTAFHDFCARLAHENRLLRMYTQNIDGLEIALDPLKYDANSLPLPKKGPWPKVLQLHGGLAKASCTKCGALSELDASKFDGPIPPACQECESQDQVRTAIAGKRSHGVGRLRPRMVLYHEHNPDDEAIGACTSADLRARPDCVIVAGTSMKIPGVRRIVREMCKIVRDRKDGMTVWINHDSEPAGKEFEGLWDVIVEGGSDQVAELAGLGRWDDPEVKIHQTTVEDDRIAEAAARLGQPEVVLDTLVHTEIKTGGLPTPRDSPQLTESASDAKAAGKKLKQTTISANKSSTATSASKTKAAKGPAKPRGRKPKAETAGTKKGKAAAKSTAGTQTLNFHTSKPAAAQASTVKIKAELAPSTPKRKRSGLSEAPDPLSKQNCSPSTPRGINFPGLSKKTELQPEASA